MTTIHAELMSQLQSGIFSKAGKKSASIGLCALEMVYRCMRSFGNITWDVPESHVLHPMVSSFFDRSDVRRINARVLAANAHDAEPAVRGDALPR
jgi:hypothetical protein